MYTVTHTKGLARYFTSFFLYRPSLLPNTTFSTSFVSLGLGPGPFLAQPLSHTPLDFFSCFTTFCNMVHVHPFQVPWAPHDKPSHRHANGCKQVFTLKHPSALDGHTHSTAPTHTVPKHAGPSGHSFIPQVGTPHVCTQFQQSPIFYLIVIDFAPAHHILGLSLPNSTLLSNFLLLTFHTIVDFHTHMHLPFVNCHQLCTQCLWATTIHPPPVFPPLHH